MVEATDSAAASPASCRNCGAVLQGEYCHDCGQGTRDMRTPIWAAVAIFFQQTFGLDGRFWMTFRKLIIQPGALTIEFLEGKQRRSLHPLRLFLICGVLGLLTPEFINPPRLDWPEEWKELAPAGSSFVDRFWLGEERLKAWGGNEDLADEQRFAFAMELNKSYLVWVLLASVAFGVLASKILRPRRLLYDHIVFLLHVVSFAYVSDAIFRSLGITRGGDDVPLRVVQSIYTMLAFRRVYPLKLQSKPLAWVLDLAAGFVVYTVIDIASRELLKVSAVYHVMPAAP